MGANVHDPRKLNLNVLGVRVEGFSKGSFVTVSKEGDRSFKVRSSLRGSKVVERKKYPNYELTFRLDNTAPANTWLHAIHKLQVLYGVVFPVPILYTDGNGTTNFFCLSGVLEEPNIDQGDDVGTNEWVIHCPKASTTISGIGQDVVTAKALQYIAGALSIADFVGMDLSALSGQAQGLLESAKGSIGGILESFR